MQLKKDLDELQQNTKGIEEKNKGISEEHGSWLKFLNSQLMMIWSRRSI